MIALQHEWHTKLLQDSTKITVNWKQIGQSIFSAPSDVQRTGRSPLSTSSQSVLTIFLETPATTGPVFLPCLHPPLDLTTPPWLAPSPRPSDQVQKPELHGRHLRRLDLRRIRACARSTEQSRQGRHRPAICYLYTVLIVHTLHPYSHYCFLCMGISDSNAVLMNAKKKRQKSLQCNSKKSVGVKPADLG